jgi:Putative zinc-finger
VTTDACPPEPVLAVFADGELAGAEVRQVEEHVARCQRCLPLLDALRDESRLLASAFEEAPARASNRRSVWPDLATTAVCLLGAAAGVQSLFGWLGEIDQQSAVRLDARSFVVSLLFDTLFYLVREGASMVTPLASTLGLAVLGALMVFLALSARRRSVVGPLLLLALCGLGSPAAALERRLAHGGHDEITVRAGETVDDSLLAAGETVSIDGLVTGNLLAFANRVIVRGTVKGDLVTCAQRVDLAGTVEGNVLSASQTLVVRGPVGRSLHSLAEHVALDREGSVEGDLFGLVGGMDLEGRVGRDLIAGGGFANLKGEVGRNASTWTDRLRVEAKATIGGDLVAHAHEKTGVTVDPEATVRGKSETRITPKHHQSRYRQPAFYVWRAIWLAAALLTGLLVHRLFPALFATRLEGVPISRTLGVGFVVLVAAPVAILIAALTMVGLPLALLGLALWAASLYLSTIFAGAVVGRAVFERGGTVSPFAITLLVGLAMVSVVVNLPYVGWLIGPFVTLFGLGIGADQTVRAWRRAHAE